jgi:hypothetical protein
MILWLSKTERRYVTTTDGKNVGMGFSTHFDASKKNTQFCIAKVDRKPH